MLSDGNVKIDTVDAERALLFTLLARLLGSAPDAALLTSLSRLAAGPGELGEAQGALSAAARVASVDSCEREYFNLFIGVGRGEILPYASYYLTGFLHERPLADLRGDLMHLGVERAEGVAEPEDHFSFVSETLSGLLDGRFGPGGDAASTFFARHMRPWAGRLFADLERAEAAVFYRAVGRLGRIAIEIEAVAADLPA